MEAPNCGRLAAVLLPLGGAGAASASDLIQLGPWTPVAVLAAVGLWALALALVALRVGWRAAMGLGAMAILTWISGALEGGGVAAWMLPPLAAGAALLARPHR